MLDIVGAPQVVHSIQIAWIESDGLPVAVNCAFNLVIGGMVMLITFEEPECGSVEIVLLVHQKLSWFLILALNIDLVYPSVPFQVFNQMSLYVIQIVVLNLPDDVFLPLLLFLAELLSLGDVRDLSVFVFGLIIMVYVRFGLHAFGTELAFTENHVHNVSFLVVETVLLGYADKLLGFLRVGSEATIFTI